MPYLPPHLRDGGGSGGSGSESDGGRGSRGPDRFDDRRGGGGGSSSRSGVPPAVFANWKPSERVQALSVNQVRVPPHLTPRRA